MKIFVKTLKGSHFEIEVKPEDTVRFVFCQSILFKFTLFYLFFGLIFWSIGDILDLLNNLWCIDVIVVIYE